MSDRVQAGRSELRRQAELKLQSLASLPPGPSSAREVRQLVHELQIYQIELEMQNEQLRASNRLVEAAVASYAELYDFAPVGYFLLFPDGTIDKLNRLAAALLGGDRAKLHGQRLGGFLTAGSQVVFETFLARVFAKADGPPCQVESDGPDGQRILSIQAVLSLDGQQCQTVMTDVTEREQARRAAQTQRQFAAAIIDAVSVQLCVLDATGKIIAVNQVWRDVWNSSFPDPTDKPYFLDSDYLEVCDLATGPWAEGATGMAAGIRSVMDGRSDAYGVEYTCHEPDGPQHWFRAVVTPFRGESGNVVVAHEEISERKFAEAERQSLESRLRVSQRMQAIGTLASGIAHDFNNILAAIIGFTEAAQQETPVDSPVQEALEEVLAAGGRATALVKQILTFGRSEKIDRLPLQLVAVITEALRLLRASCSSSIEFRINLSPTTDFVQACAGQIHQVVLNLGSNAMHAIGTDPGQITVTLENCLLDAEAASRFPGLLPGAHVRLAVVDSGHGMDRQTTERAFDLFFTTKGPDQGTGLGLSVVYGIVQEHEGAIKVESALGCGTTVEVFFPAVSARLQTPPAARKNEEGGRGQRILVVDDEAPVGNVSGLLLQRHGYSVEVENSPVRAVEIFLSRPDDFELVITDLNMPGLSGTELAAQLHACRPNLPILLSSGFSANLTPESLRSVGIREVMSKPVSSLDLRETVHRNLPPRPSESDPDHCRR